MNRTLPFVLALCTLVPACASYRYVHRTPDGGTVAIQGDRAKAMQKARNEMQAHCMGPYRIVEEGEFVTGHETRQTEATEYDADGATTQTDVTTQDTTEWRVRYECVSLETPADPAA